MSNLKRLQDWYAAQCNGDWEHSFGVTIETLDNPGWLVKIELAETDWADLKVERKVSRRDESDWIEFEVTNSEFIAAGGSQNLEELLAIFFDLIEFEPSSSA